MTTALLTSSAKRASPDYPIQKLLADRWSPYAFSDQPVPDIDLASLFEAARWAASSYNEQPWIYFVATKKDFREYERILSCLVPENQAWAKAAPALALGIVSLRFSKTNKDNKAAIHDLGLASANLVMEATSRDLSVHQMIGILPETARELYQIPAHFEAYTALAIGYPENADASPDALRARDLSPRQRKPISQFVFSGTWGQSSPLTHREFTPATT